MRLGPIGIRTYEARAWPQRQWSSLLPAGVPAAEGQPLRARVASGQEVEVHVVQVERTVRGERFLSDLVETHVLIAL